MRSACVLTILWQMPVLVMGLDFAMWSVFAIWLILHCSILLYTSLLQLQLHGPVL
jgi:hypothetical protein